MQKKLSQLIAHRGASGEAPENTLIAFQKAIDIGVDFIEFDVRLTKDDIPVVIHDARVSRTTGNADISYVHDLTLAQLKKLDVGKWFGTEFVKEKIPSLEEVLLATSNQLGLMIEIKAGIQSPKTIVTSILNVLQTSNANPETLKFGSFSVPIIQEIINKSPLSNVMGIVEEVDKIENFLDLGIKHLALWYKLIDSSLIQRLHNNGINIWTFTVDDPEIALFLQSLSINGIITNQPRLIQSQLVIN